MPADAIAAQFGVTTETVEAVANGGPAHEVNRWTKADVERAISMRRSKFSHRAIAEALGRTEQAVAKKLAKLGMAESKPNCRRDGGNAWTDDEILNLADMCERGVPYADICAKLGRSMRSIYNKASDLRAEGIINDSRLGRGSLTQEAVDGILDAVRGGMSNKDAAAKFGVCDRSVSRICVNRGFRRRLRWTREMKDRLARLYDADGMSFEEISDAMGIDEIRVKAMVGQLRRQGAITRIDHPRKAKLSNSEGFTKTATIVDTPQPDADPAPRAERTPEPAPKAEPEAKPAPAGGGDFPGLLFRMADMAVLAKRYRECLEAYDFIRAKDAYDEILSKAREDF